MAQQLVQQISVAGEFNDLREMILILCLVQFQPLWSSKAQKFTPRVLRNNHNNNDQKINNQNIVKQQHVTPSLGFKTFSLKTFQSNSKISYTIL